MAMTNALFELDFKGRYLYILRETVSYLSQNVLNSTEIVHLSANRNQHDIQMETKFIR